MLYAKTFNSFTLKVIQKGPYKKYPFTLNAVLSVGLNTPGTILTRAIQIKSMQLNLKFVIWLPGGTVVNQFET